MKTPSQPSVISVPPLAPVSPLGWSALARLGVALVLAALLWGAVGWALGWW